MNMNTSLIELTGVIKRFGTHVAVDRLSMKVEKGEIVALLGRTGAGKSTVMSLLMGTTSVDEGQIRVAGVDPAASFQALRGKMSVSFQTERLLPWRTACENVELGLLILNKSKAEARTIALEWLRRHGNPYLLSVSDSQGRVGIDYGAYGVPETFVIDKAGIIRFKYIGPITPEAMRDKLIPLIRELQK